MSADAKIWDEFKSYGQQIELTKLEGQKIAIDGQLFLDPFFKKVQTLEQYMFLVFKWFCTLLKHRIKPVVIFDEPDGALEERTDLQKSIEEFLEQFGIPHFRASGDVVARAALLNLKGQTSGTITTSFSAFYYGAKDVYKPKLNSIVKNSKYLHFSRADLFHCYRLNDDKLICFALFTNPSDGLGTTPHAALKFIEDIEQKNLPSPSPLGVLQYHIEYQKYLEVRDQIGKDPNVYYNLVKNDPSVKATIERLTALHQRLLKPTSESDINLNVDLCPDEHQFKKYLASRYKWPESKFKQHLKQALRGYYDRGRQSKITDYLSATKDLSLIKASTSKGDPTKGKSSKIKDEIQPISSPPPLITLSSEESPNEAVNQGSGKTVINRAPGGDGMEQELEENDPPTSDPLGTPSLVSEEEKISSQGSRISADGDTTASLSGINYSLSSSEVLCESPINIFNNEFTSSQEAKNDSDSKDLSPLPSESESCKIKEENSPVTARRQFKDLSDLEAVSSRTKKRRLGN